MRDANSGLIAEHHEAASAPERIPPKVYGVMAGTMVLTFATLMTGYQWLFPPHQLFA